MKTIGDKLTELGGKIKRPAEYDLYYRSAFNRYYYATFLCVRATLRTINTQWSTPSHTDIPVILQSTVLKLVQNAAKAQHKGGQITAGDKKRLVNNVMSSVGELVSLLNTARAVRRVADYEPEQPVTRDGGVVKLEQCTLDSAASWCARAEMNVKIILRVCRELGITS